MLRRAREVAELPEADLPEVVDAVVANSGLLELIDRELPDTAALEGGYVQDELIRRSVAAVCTDTPELRDWLPSVCGAEAQSAMRERDPLAVIRAGLLLDTARLPGRLTSQVRGASKEEWSTQLQILLAVIDALTGDASPEAAAAALASAMSEADSSGDPCSALPLLDQVKLQGLGLSEDAARRLQQAAGLLLRLRRDLRAVEGVSADSAVLLVQAALASLRPAEELQELAQALESELARLEGERERALQRLREARSAQEGTEEDGRAGEVVAEAEARLAAIEAEARAAYAKLAAPLSESKAQAATQLVQALLEWEERNGARSAASLVVQRLELSLTALENAILLSQGTVSGQGAADAEAPSVSVWSEEVRFYRHALLAGLATAVSGDLRAAEDAATAALSAFLQDGAQGSTPHDVERSLRALFQLAQARTTNDLRKVALAYLVNLGPWANNLIFGLNLGAVQVLEANGDYRFAGDLTVGYSADRWGAAAEGYVNSFALDDGQRLVDTYRGGGGAEAWIVTRPSSYRFELRGLYAGEYFDSDNIRVGPVDPDSELPDFFDETRWFHRGNLLVALRLEPAPNFGLYFGGGGGFQVESFNSLSAGAGLASIQMDDEVTGSATSRVRLQWLPWPDVLALRATNDTLWAGFSTKSESITAGSGAIDTIVERSTGWRLETITRAFVDLEFARFLGGFVPGVTAGVDYIAIGDGDNTVSAAIPLFQAGVRRVEF